MNLRKKIDFLKFIEIFVLLQPILDFLTSLTTRLIPGAPTIGMFVRIAFVAVVCLYILFFYRDQFSRLLKGMVIAVTVYGALNVLSAGYFNGTASLLESGKMFFKTYYFVYVLLLFFALYRGRRFVIQDRHLVFVYLAYTLSIFLSAVTGTSFTTYTHRAGYCGWFYAGNEVSAIVGALAGVALLWAFLKRNVLWSLLTIFLTAFCASYIGTKVPFLAMAGAGVVLLVYYVLRLIFLKAERRNSGKILWKAAALLAVIALIYSLNSPFMQNTATMLGDRYDNYVTDELDKQEQPGSSSGGGSQKSESYLVLNWLLSNRLNLSDKAVDAYEQSSVVRKLLGLGYGFPTADGGTYSRLIEMDLLVLVINHGILGLLLFMGPILLFAVLCAIKLFRNIRRFWHMEHAVICIYSILILLGCALLSGHVFVAPAVSIYLAILIVRLYDELSPNIEER